MRSGSNIESAPIRSKCFVDDLRNQMLTEAASLQHNGKWFSHRARVSAATNLESRLRCGEQNLRWCLIAITLLWLVRVRSNVKYTQPPILKPRETLQPRKQKSIPQSAKFRAEPSIDRYCKKREATWHRKKTWAPSELATYYAIICFSRETLPRNQLNSEDIDARRVTKALRNKNQHLPLSPLGLLLLLRLFCGFNSELVLVRSMS